MLIIAFLLGAGIFYLREVEKPEQLPSNHTNIVHIDKKVASKTGIVFEDLDHAAIVFIADSSGKLDVKLKGYSGMSEAAEDFFNILKGRIICPQDVTFKGEWHDEPQ
jgi:hypothetical protein